MLKRLAKSIRKQDWPTIGIEFFIVVLSIFVALQVDNWNQSRIDRQDEQAFLVRLHADIEQAESLSARVRDRRLEALEDLISANDVLLANRVGTPLSEAQCKAVSSSHVLNIALTSLPSVQELSATGRLGIMRDEKLRMQLVIIQQSQQTLGFMLSTWANLSVPLASKYPDLILLKAMREGEGTEVRSRATCDSDAMRADQGFRNDFSSNVDTYDAYLRDGLVPWVVSMQALHARLDELLNIEHIAAGD